MTRTFSVADPLSFEGTPYEVAARALAQVRALNQLTFDTLEAADTMIRNAELSRNLEIHDAPRASGWDESAQARKIHAVQGALGKIDAELVMLERAAGFDPRAGA